MALPVSIFTPSSVSLKQAYIGPQKSSGGAFYVIGADFATNVILKAFKATDPTSSFSEQDTGNRPRGGSTNVNSSLWTTKKSDILYSAYQDGDFDVFHARFNMGTDGWVDFGGGDYDQAIDTAPAGDDGPLARAVSIAVEETGTDIVVVYQGQADKDMGTEYARIDASRYVSSWSSPIAIDSGGASPGPAVHWTGPVIVQGSSDRMHVFFKDHTNNDGYMRTLRSDDSLQTFPSAFDSALSATAYIYSNGVSFTSGADRKVRCIYADVLSGGDNLSVVGFNSADSPTATKVTSQGVTGINTGGNANHQTLAVDGTTMHALAIQSTDADIYGDNTDGDDDVWGNDAEILDAVTANGIFANIYDRSGTKHAYIYDDGGTIKYNEVDLAGGVTTMTADAGSYTWTGSAANTEYHRVMTAAAGSYAWTGTAATTFKSFIMVADAGGYTWTGTDANTEYHRVMPADVGAYTWTGTDANTEYHRVMAAAAGAYVWTGTDATTSRSITIAAEAGAYTWTGTDANTEYHRVMAADAGSYVWTGTDAATLVSIKMAADAGGYTWTGTDANTEYHRVMPADVGAYTWTGTDANTEYHRVMTADAGAYVWTGTDATTLVSIKMTADAGSYSWTGTAVNFALNMPAAAGSYTWTGTAATTSKSTILTAEAGSYAWTGTAATTLYDRVVAAEAGAFVWTGSDANTEYHRVMAAASGSYTWSGTAAATLYNRLMSAAAGAYVWTGTAATTTYTPIAAVTLVAETGVFVWTGSAATLIAPIWTPVSGASATWAATTPESSVWTPVDPEITNWS